MLSTEAVPDASDDRPGSLRPTQPGDPTRLRGRSRKCWIGLEAPPGFEPGMEVLQTSALPLGYGALSGNHERGREEGGAGNGIRTRDFDLGKVALYH